jgi:cation diffusion facilitator CzcD-associated flavoprotein CzcO
VVHPQKWPSDLDYAGKRVVVIGSGATAVTLVPAMAATAAHVTMLQRSPSYVVSLPAEDPIANWLNRHLPSHLAYAITRWKNVLLGMLFFGASRRWPGGMKKLIVGGVKRALGAGYDVGTHFTPRYNPWDQRLCLVPDADLFRTIKHGRASVVTDTVASFTEKGIRLGSGDEIEADVVVTATGLDLLVLGGVELVVDGESIDLAKTLNYKGMMLAGVPNLASAIGYTNASWTLKCDLTCEYVCRLLNHMAKHGLRQCTARRNDPSIVEVPWVDFTSGYIQRSIHKFPKQGNKKPWRLYQNYLLDVVTLRFGSVDDEAMEFSNPDPARSRAENRMNAAA